MPPRPRRAPKPQVIERSIHFFKVDCGAGEGGKPLPFDCAPVLEQINSKPFKRAAVGGRYVPTSDGEAHCAWVDEDAEELIDGFQPRRVRFGRLRRNAIPQFEQAGELAQIDLGAGSSLCETSHLLILPNNIVGAEFNFFGPRAARFADYMQHLSGQATPPFGMEQLLRQDVLVQLKNQQAIRAFDLAIRPSYADIISEVSPNLGAALNAAREASDASVIGVYLKADPRKHSDTLGTKLFRQVRRIGRLPGLRENAMRAQVRSVGPDGTMRDLDLLQDLLVISKKITSVGAMSAAMKN